MSRHNYRYLNRDTGLMFSPLYKAISEGQERAPANQWPNIINSLKNKGVREAEINDSNLVDYVKTLEGPVTKDVLLKHLNDNAHLVKEIDVTRQRYKRYSYAKYGTDYTESLYLLASEDDFLQDKLLDIQFELDDLDFYPERLMDNPLLAHELYEQEQEIKKQLSSLSAKSKVSISHWSGVKDPDTGKEIESLLFHTRTSVQEEGKTFFVEEIQSDWAQKGRQRDWESIPKAPWVANTDLWTGLAFRRLMQRAAMDPAITKFSWITGDYRNGGNFIVDDGLNDFYIKVVGKAVNRALSGTGEKANFTKVKLGDNEIELPSFNMTDKVREKLKQAQPMYSRDHAMREISERALARLTPDIDAFIKNARHMVGDAAQIKLLTHLVDAENNPVSGRFLGQCIEVSLAGQNPARALAHESWHYTYDNLLAPSERHAADTAFTNGNPILNRLIETMRKQGMSEAAIAQCEDPQEAAAHAFSLWVNGDLTLGENAPTLGGAFKKAEGWFNALQQQVTESYRLNDVADNSTAAEHDLLAMFEQLRDGALACREQQYATPSMG